ncbi:MAG: hypothetical protein IJH99_07100 [Eubacterium sp.]|nr:hypothetical protein [Eubacterium sp.]
MKHLKHLFAFLIAIILIMTMHASAYADYIHEYFRYTVEDNSVTITAYLGNETAVTVPAMIGGNPVNVIAAGAFANNTTVTVVYLPDTIMSVETGAFGPGQSVIYTCGYTENDSGDTQQPDTPAQPLGIYDDYGNLITTDDEGNLLLVDSNGNERVLDDTQDYYRNSDDEGNLTIVSESGAVIEVTDGVTVSFEDGNSNQVVVHTDDGSMQVTNEETGTAMETVEIDLTEEDGTEESSKNTTGSSQADSGEANPKSEDKSADSVPGHEDENTQKDTSGTDGNAGLNVKAVVFTVVIIAVAVLIGVYVRKNKTR